MRLALSLLSAATVAAVSLMPAHAATRSFPVGTFDRVQSNVPFDVRVHVGGAPAVTADGPQELVDRLDIRSDGGRLAIRMRPGHWSWNGSHGHLLISVTAPRLVGADLSGPGNLDVDQVRAPDFDATLSGPGNLRIGTLEARRVSFDLSGPGDIRVAGRADRALMRLSGPGNIRAQGLALGDLDVSLSGPGDIETTVSGTASGHLSGPGTIRIDGHARCQIAKSGPGDVHCG